MRTPRLVLNGLLGLGLLTALNARAEETPDYQVETRKPFQEVVDDLKLAISEKNFRLTGHNQIGKAIRERDGQPFPDYDLLQFCNVGYAKDYLQLNPDGIRNMPCTVAVYVKNGTVIVSAHQLPTHTGRAELDQFDAKINGLLRDILNEAVKP